MENKTCSITWQMNSKEFNNPVQSNDKLYRTILHDLRNAAVGINSVAGLIQERLRNSNLLQILHFNKLILNASESLLYILEDFETYLKIRITRSEEHFQNFSVSSLMPSLLAVTATMASNKNISIECNISEDSIVFANRWLTSTILRNLIINSIKFTERNGKVIISSEIVKDYLEVSVIDTGVGIDPHDIEKMFRTDLKFTRPGTEKEKGTGLGLIICKEFVEMQNGRIWVKSKIGYGSKFSFILPLVGQV